MTVMVVANGNVGPLNFLLLMVVVQWTSLALTREIVQFTLVGGLVDVVHHFLIFIIVCVIIITGVLTIIIKTVFGGVFVGHEPRHVRFVLEWASVTKLLGRVENLIVNQKKACVVLLFCLRVLGVGVVSQQRSICDRVGLGVRICVRVVCLHFKCHHATCERLRLLK